MGVVFEEQLRDAAERLYPPESSDGSESSDCAMRAFCVFKQVNYSVRLHAPGLRRALDISDVEAINFMRTAAHPVYGDHIIWYFPETGLERAALQAEAVCKTGPESVEVQKAPQQCPSGSDDSGQDNEENENLLKRCSHKPGNVRRRRRQREPWPTSPGSDEAYI